ncbi:hypothetical protein MLD38_021514 [Melastoma candidum]|uniref:Uncharacterized protein n=1 Tax=Melastoma candidum TaxID=119954 RepID=A0ACB9QGH0_9MYRT|nr:hypothetical protein MLD38_021514 [Melastoma candidum]
MDLKPISIRNVIVRTLLLGLFLLALRFSYLVAIAGKSCSLSDFCFFDISSPSSISAASFSAVPVDGSAPKTPRQSKEWISAVRFYSSVFRDLISDAFLSPRSKSLCVDTASGDDVFALREIGVKNALGIYRKAALPLVKSGLPHRIPFGPDTFDFVFIGRGRFDEFPRPLDVVAEIERVTKPRGHVVFHVKANDSYSFNSFMELFDKCVLLRMHDVDGFQNHMPRVREIVLQKESDVAIHRHLVRKDKGGAARKCIVPEYKQKLVVHAEPLIEEEPLKPWITLKRNLNNIKYLPSIVDISFRNRYVYVDVGARGYGSSIGSWFRKQYPKQNRTFQVYAIEADKSFYPEYKIKKAVTLLPYAAWVKNETLSFEINRDPDSKLEGKGRGMGRIQPGQAAVGNGEDKEVVKIRGFDFADWLKSTVSPVDYVVMKMDVEGTEFDLIPRLFETGAICLIDEMFLECHYNRWQRCCPGQRSSKYDKTYGQCLELFRSLRQSGVLVHQWW